MPVICPICGEGWFRSTAGPGWAFGKRCWKCGRLTNKDNPFNGRTSGAMDGPKATFGVIRTHPGGGLDGGAPSGQGGDTGGGEEQT